MLTVKDLLQLQKLIADTLDEKLKQFYEKHIQYLPTKKEFFTRMDKLSGEFKKIDEAETLHVGTLSDHTDQLENHDQRITALENRKSSAPASISFPQL